MPGPWEDYKPAPAGPWQDYATPEGGDPTPQTVSVEANYKGKKVRFDAPKDTSDEDMRKLASDAFAKAGVKTPSTNTYNVRRNGQITTAADAPPKSIWDYATMTGRAILNGVASIPDALGAFKSENEAQSANDLLKFMKDNPNLTGQQLMDLSQNGYQPAHAPASFTGGATSLSDMAGLAKPDTPGQRVYSAGVSGVAGAAVPVLGAEGLAARGVKAAAPFAAQKGVQLLSGFTGGSSGAIAKEAGASPLVQAGASILGGVAPLGAASTIKNVGSAVRAVTTEAGAAEGATRTLQNAATDVPQTIANIRSAPKPASTALPTLAEVAKDPSLAGFQRAKTTTPVAERLSSNAVARGQAADAAFGPGKPQAVQDVATQTAADNATAISSGRENIGPVADRADTGAQARASFDEAHNAARARTGAAYNAPALTAEPKPVTLSNSFHNDVGEALKPFYGDGSAPMSPDLAQIVEDLRAPDATTARFGNIDKRLADFSANIRRAGGSNTEAAAADSLRNVIEARAGELLPPDQVQALKAARAARAEQGATFEQNGVGRAMGDKRYGEPAVPDTELPGRIIKPGPGGGSTADQLVTATGADKAEDIARQEMRRMVDEKQLETGGQVQALMTRYGESLSRFPKLQADLGILKERAALNDAFLASPLGKMANAGADPSSEIAKLLTAKDGGRQLAVLYTQVKGNPEAVSGLRRSLAGFVRHEAQGAGVTAEGVNIPSANKMRDALNTVLDRTGPAHALSAQQRTVLQRVRDELAAVNYADSAGKVPGAVESPDAALLEIGSMAAHAAPTGLKAVFSFLRNKVGNGKAVDALIEKAILDPSFAADLLSRPTPDRLKNIGATLSASARGAAASSLTQTGSQQ